MFIQLNIRKYYFDSDFSYAVGPKLGKLQWYTSLQYAIPVVLKQQRPAQKRVGMWWTLDLTGGSGSVECPANFNFQLSLVYFPNLQTPIPLIRSHVSSKT